MASKHKRARPLLRGLPHYGMAAAAALAAHSLHGQIIFLDNTHAFTVHEMGGGYLWDVDGNGATDFRFHGATFGSGDFIAAHNTEGHWINEGLYNYTLKPLPAGFTIGPTLPAGAVFNLGRSNSFTTHGHAQLHLSFGSQFVGFEFQISGTTHYGWANVTLSSQTLVVNDWAYNNVASQSIQAGQTVVPEPADAAMGLGLLALGAAGVARYKRSKKNRLNGIFCALVRSNQ